MSTDVDELRAMLDELPPLIQQAHGAVRDLRQTIREAQRVIKSDTRAVIFTAVDEQLKAVGTAVERVISERVDRIAAQLDRLARRLSAINPGTTSPEALAQFRQAVGMVRAAGEE